MQHIERLIKIPFSVKYLKPAWASFYLAICASFFFETSIRNVPRLLNEQYNIPVWMLPVAFGVAGVLFIIWHMLGIRLTYWQAFIWAIPVWLHLLAGYAVGIPYTARIYITIAGVCLVWMADIVESNTPRG